MSLTPYDQLPVLEGLGLPHAWNEFGPDDELGTINLLTPERMAAAMKSVREGRVFNLTLPLNLPSPPMFGRKPFEHIIFSNNRHTQDDYVNALYLQGSSQWDSLRHVRAREFGFYGGRQAEDAGESGNKLGIDKWVQHGIIGRAVLVDVEHYLAKVGTPLDPFSDATFDVDVVRAAADDQAVAFETGDILLLRTGWMRAYLNATPEHRAELADHRQWAGIRPDERTAKFLWDNHFAAIAADNPAIENAPGDPSIGSLHRRVLPLMGLAMGELWIFEELAEYARTTANWCSCLVSIPLNIPNAVGSPANAIAVV